MLVFNGLAASAFADFLSFIAHLRHQVCEEAHVGFKARRGGIDLGRQHTARRRAVCCEGVVAFSHDLRTRTDYGIPVGRNGSIQRSTGAGLGSPWPLDLLWELLGILCAKKKH